MVDCEYLHKCNTNTKKDDRSISSLIDIPLSQSQCIQFGIAIEQYLRYLILKTIPHLEDIRPKNKKGEHEKDHLFVNEANKTIYYAEIKANLYLDTEKTKKTKAKCLKIQKQLLENYPDHTVKMFLVGARYLYSSDMDKPIMKKWASISNNVVGVNDYIIALGFPLEPLTTQDYRVFLNKMAEMKFGTLASVV